MTASKSSRRAARRQERERGRRGPRYSREEKTRSREGLLLPPLISPLSLLSSLSSFLSFLSPFSSLSSPLSSPLSSLSSCLSQLKAIFAANGYSNVITLEEVFANSVSRTRKSLRAATSIAGGKDLSRHNRLLKIRNRHRQKRREKYNVWLVFKSAFLFFLFLDERVDIALHHLSLI